MLLYKCNKEAHTEQEVKEMERNDWLVLVNKECSIKGGDAITCESKSKAINIASYVARVLYNTGAYEKHVFVVNRRETGIETLVDREDFEYKVISHYLIVYYADLGLKMLIHYDCWCENQKKIASQWIGE